MSTHAKHADRSTTASQFASALAGGAAGFAAGLVLAQLFGGWSGIAARLGRAAADELGMTLDSAGDDDEADDDLADDWNDDDARSADDALGERVLEAFRNDPTLVERAIDIEVGPDATIELSGCVDAQGEVRYAATIAGGVPGVRHVVTRLDVDHRTRTPAPT
jgi:hypothetical protein